MIDSATSFVSELRSGKILRGDWLDEIDRDLQFRFPDPQALARDLIRRGWLTPYQINQLFRGKGDQLLLGPYVLQERLGQSEIGLVFKARHRHLNRVSAVQVVREDLLADPDAVARFYEEVQAVSHLAHVNVVHLYDAGPIGRTHFFAMEYVPGIDLKRLVKKDGRLPIAQACDYVSQTALGLQHAHERGLMHHALKPSFLLICEGKDAPDEGPQSGVPAGRSLVKILNLGVTHLVNTTGQEHTQALGGDANGLVSFDYIAPEQAEEALVRDVRSELYSLGCIFYFALTGQPPFAGGAVADKLLRHAREEAPPVAGLRDDVPPEVAEVVHRLLAKHPDDRFQTPSEVAQALGVNPYGEQTLCETRVVASLPDPAAPAYEDPLSPSVSASVTAILRQPRRDNPFADPPHVIISTVAGIPTPPPGPAASLPVSVPNRWWKFVAAGAAAVFLMILLGTFLVVRGLRARSPGGVTTADREKARTALQAFEDRARDPKTDMDALRKELVAVRAGVAGTSEAVKAGELMTRLPSALDKLTEDSIPREERFAWQPRELVGVFGEHQPKAWMTERFMASDPKTARVATMGGDGTIRVWNLTNRQMVANVATRPGVAHALFSPNGKFLATGHQDRFVRLWDVATGASHWASDAHKAQIQTMAFSPDGNFLASTSVDRFTKVWDVAAGKEVLEVPPPPVAGRMWSVAFTGDGKALVTAGWRIQPLPRTVELKVWDLPGGALRTTIELPPTHLPQSMLSPATGTTIATVGNDSSVQFWDLTTGKNAGVIQVPPMVGIAQAKLIPGGRRLITVGRDHSIRVWGLPAGDLQVTLNGHTAPIFYLSASADGERVTTAAQDQTVRMWDLSLAKAAVVSGPSGFVGQVAVAPDGRFLATGHLSGTVKLWDAATGKLKTSLPGHDLGVTALAFSPDGRTLASVGYDQVVKLWDVEGARETASLPAPSPFLTLLAFAPDGRTLAAGGVDAWVWLWNLQTHKGGPVPCTTGQLTALTFTPDGKEFYTGGGDGNLRQWSASDGKARFAQPIHRVAIRTMDLSSDGQTLVSAGAGETLIRVWGLIGTEARERKPLPGHASPPVALALSPDGANLASTSEAGQVYVLDLQSGKKLKEWVIGGGPARSILYAPDGRHLISVNGNGTCYVLRLEPPAMNAARN